MDEWNTPTKLCRGCGMWKRRAAFYRARTRRDGRTSRCAECERARVAAYQRAQRMDDEQLQLDVSVRRLISQLKRGVLTESACVAEVMRLMRTLTPKKRQETET